MRNWLQAIPTTEAYWVNKVLFDTQHNPDLMARFRADPEAYMKGMPIPEKTRQAIFDNDIGAIYLAGANPYLLRAHCLSLRVSEDDYLAALHALTKELEHG